MLLTHVDEEHARDEDGYLWVRGSDGIWRPASKQPELKAISGGKRGAR